VSFVTVHSHHKKRGVRKNGAYDILPCSWVVIFRPVFFAHYCYTKTKNRKQ